MCACVYNKNVYVVNIYDNMCNCLYLSTPIRVQLNYMHCTTSRKKKPTYKFLHYTHIYKHTLTCIHMHTSLLHTHTHTYTHTHNSPTLHAAVTSYVVQPPALCCPDQNHACTFAWPAHDPAPASCDLACDLARSPRWQTGCSGLMTLC